MNTKNKFDLEKFKAAASAKGLGGEYIHNCAEYAQALMDKNLPVIFDAKHLALQLKIPEKLLLQYANDVNYHYHEKVIPKKSGGKRVLLIPSVNLKLVQRWILENILNPVEISWQATGFCKNKSIVHNALPHLQKECVLNMDISNFFPSIEKRKVFFIFRKLGYTKKVSEILARLCTYLGFLPQGAPTSPCISNIVCKNMDKRLKLLADKAAASYTRYADDITFSGSFDHLKTLETTKRVLKDNGFTINASKTRFAFKHRRQEVTGLTVNCDKIKVRKSYKKKLSQEIYFCKKFGVSGHLERIKCDKSFYKEHLYGKAYYIKMAEPALGIKILAELDQIIWDY